MPALRISRYPEPVLIKISKPVVSVGEEERALLDDMLETMYLNQGVGLAAPQVGVPKRIIVIDVGDGPVCIINPVVIKKWGRDTVQEGCLSVPEATVEVKRAAKVTFKGLDRQGRPIEGGAEGLFARAIQHEIDHLNGKLIIDYANPIKKIFMKRRLTRNRRGT
jgi:peptide deformylase